MLLSHLSEFPCKHENLKFAVISLENAAMVKEILQIIYCKMFYDPSKYVIQMLQMFKSA